jgi:hypothetical protein
MKAIRKYFSDLREYREAVLAGQAAIVGELQILNRAVSDLAAQRTDTLTRLTAAAESLTEMQRALLTQSHPHLVR